MKWFVAMLGVGLLSVPSPSRAEDVSEKLSAYMDAAVEAGGFNGSVLVAKDGKVLLAKGYGLANAEHDVPNTPETKFRLGSITKQFTATAILILQDQGKLKVQDAIGKYLDDAPKAWDEITIHQLLTHTSGVPSYTDDPSYGKFMSKPETVATMIDRFKDRPLDFPPGEKFHYSNSGYFLLGAIIEKVSGKTYETFLKDEIFEPLGMKNTGYDRPSTVLTHRASGYDRKDQGLVNCDYLDMNQPYAAGSLYSTVEDLFLWDRALRDGKLLSKDAMTAMFTPEKNNYAYGWSVDTQGDHPHVGHGGGINGFATNLERFPNDDVFVVALCNVLPANPGKVTRDLAAITFGENVPLPRARVVAKVDPKLYDDYAGTYQILPKLSLTITREGDRLMVEPTGQEKLELFPENDTIFFLKVDDVVVTFVREDGKVGHLIVKQGGREMKGKRVEVEKEQK